MKLLAITYTHVELDRFVVIATAALMMAIVTMPMMKVLFLADILVGQWRKDADLPGGHAARQRCGF